MTAWIVKASVVDIFDQKDESRNMYTAIECLVLAHDFDGAVAAARIYIDKDPTDMRLEEVTEVRRIPVDAILDASGRAMAVPA